jgi:hypothetical protein
MSVEEKARRSEVEEVEQEEKLSRVLLLSIRILNFEVNLGRAAFGEILMLSWGELL